MVDPGPGTKLPRPFGGFAVPGALADLGRRVGRADFREARPTRPGAHFASSGGIGAIPLPVGRGGAPSPRRGTSLSPEAWGAEDGLAQWSRSLREASGQARQRLLALETLARQSDELAEMDFSFLFDPARELFSIGFNVAESRLDASFYDLLASEARLCSYVAIALGQVPQDHWFSLGRLLVAFARRAGAGFLERLDVRISDAAAGHAQL